MVLGKIDIRYVDTMIGINKIKIKTCPNIEVICQHNKSYSTKFSNVSFKMNNVRVEIHIGGVTRVCVDSA